MCVCVLNTKWMGVCVCVCVGDYIRLWKSVCVHRLRMWYDVDRLFFGLGWYERRPGDGVSMGVWGYIHLRWDWQIRILKEEPHKHIHVAFDIFVLFYVRTRMCVCRCFVKSGFAWDAFDNERERKISRLLFMVQRKHGSIEKRFLVATLNWRLFVYGATIKCFTGR